MTQRKCLTCGRTEDQPVEYGCRDCIGWGGEAAHKQATVLTHFPDPTIARHVVAALRASGATTERERDLVLRALQAYEKARSGR